MKVVILCNVTIHKAYGLVYEDRQFWLRIFIEHSIKAKQNRFHSSIPIALTQRLA